MPRNIIVSQEEPAFRAVTITINSKAELANILGSLLAYGTANIYAENSLKAVGLGDYYSGNVRKASRELAAVIAEASRVVPLPEFSAYLASTKFKKSRYSKAGAAVQGTDEDLSNGRDYDAGLESVPEQAAPVSSW